MPEFVVEPQGGGAPPHPPRAAPFALHACAVMLRAASEPLHGPACERAGLLLGALRRFERDEGRTLDALAVGTAALTRGLDDVATSWVAVERTAAASLRAVGSW